MAAQSLTRGTVSATLALALLSAGCQRAHTVSAADVPAFEVSLATGNQHSALAWHGGSAAHDVIYLQVLNQRGRAIGEPRPITRGQSAAYEPDLQSFADGWLLSWYEQHPTEKTLIAWLAALDGAGELRWKQALSAPGSDGRSPVVRSSGAQIHVAWIETHAGEAPAVWIASFDHAGRRLAGPIRAADASTDTWNLNAAVDAAGNFHVVYDATLGTQGKELQLLRIAGDEVKQRRLSADDGHASVYPDIALSTDQAALTWFDSRDGNEEIYLYTGALATLFSDGDIAGQRITQTPGASSGAYLAWNGSRLGLAWCDNISNQNEIFFATFDSGGKPLVAARQLTRTAAQSAIPSIRPWGSGFAIAWNEYQLGDSSAGQAGIASSAAMLQIVE